ncbi:hypothetical protein MNBD_BACTEROID05-1239, partial [hydrothermal vent metagenome]
MILGCTIEEFVFLVKPFVLSYNGIMPLTLEQKVIEALIDRNQSLSCAESCTGGLLSHKLTNIPGSSQVFLGSLITYSNASKSTLLKISTSLIKSKGAVHNDIAIEMAKKARKLFNSDYGIGITGIAGPN